MNIIGLIISSIIFIMNLRLFYEIWLFPDKIIARLKNYRKSMRDFLGFSYWEEDRANFPLMKIVNIFLLLVSALGIVVSITGPLVY